MKNNILVAVYGSLRRGMGNHDLLSNNRAEFLGEEVVPGYNMISLHAYPAILNSENQENKITIEVFSVDEDCFKRLDWLEGYPTHYNRQLQETSHGDAWIYFYDRDLSLSDDVVESGDWVEYYHERV